MDFYTSGRLFQSVQIDGIGNAVALGAAGGTVVQQQAVTGRRAVALNYRFALAPGTTPGTYAWPLQLTVRGAKTRDLQRLAIDRHDVMPGEHAEP